MADPDTLAMLADLGNGRREDYSATVERREERLSRREEAEIRQRADTRRANAHMIGQDDDEKDRILKWNTPDTFGVDDVAEQLPNHFSGQGHRTALTNAVKNLNPDLDAREGRRSRRDAPQAGRFQEPPRAPAVTQRDPNRQRAPSPRAAGVKRWRNSKSVVQNAPNRAPMFVPTAAAAASPPANSPGRITVPSSPSPVAAPGQRAIAVPPNIAPAAAKSRLRSLYDVLKGAVTSASDPAVQQTVPSHGKAAEKKPTANDPAPTPVPIQLNDPRKKIRALFDAAILSNTEIGDAYLQEARRRLAQDVVMLVRKADPDEIEVYLSRHKERSWMIENAAKARAQPDVEMDHPGLKAIYEETRNALLREAPVPAPASTPVPKPIPTQAGASGMAQEKDEVEDRGYIAVTFVDERGNYVGFQRMALPVSIQSNVTIVAPNGVANATDIATAIDALALEFGG